MSYLSFEVIYVKMNFFIVDLQGYLYFTLVGGPEVQVHTPVAGRGSIGS